MTKPVRVMHLVLKMGFGGAEVGVLKVARGCDPSKVVNSICSFLPPDAIKTQMAGVPLFEVGRRPAGNDVMATWRLCHLLRHERPDVLHTHSWATLVEGAVAARLAGVPRIVHGEHGTMETRPRNIFVQRQVWKRVDAVLSVSSRLADRLSDTVGFDRRRITTILNGVDTVRFSPSRRAAARAALGLTESDVVAGTVGRLHPVKDQRSFISAIGALARSGVHVKAFLAGDGPLREELSAHARAVGVSQSVTFLGERSDIEDVMASLDIFVLSSESEGLSNVILEAMATGVSVVATHVGGADELIVDGKTGLLVPPRDSDALAAALTALAPDPGRRWEMGRAGRVRAESDFSLTAMIRSYEDLYLSLVR